MFSVLSFLNFIFASWDKFLASVTNLPTSTIHNDHNKLFHNARQAGHWSPVPRRKKNCTLSLHWNKPEFTEPRNLVTDIIINRGLACLPLTKTGMRPSVRGYTIWHLFEQEYHSDQAFNKKDTKFK